MSNLTLRKMIWLQPWLWSTNLLGLARLQTWKPSITQESLGVTLETSLEDLNKTVSR